ncbi:MAG TPA: glycosyltransferase [Tahibacter sp.]|nr:glycosyltransferase [Tahibacter sp.]
MSKLYLRRHGGEYSEQHVVVGEACGDGTRTRFDVAAAADLVAVRFDPTAEPGVYSIRGVCWCDPDSGAELVRYATSDPGIGAVGGVRLPCAPNRPLTFWAIDQDPSLELLWPAEIRARRAPVALEVEWTYERMDESESAQLGLRLLGADRDQVLAVAGADPRPDAEATEADRLRMRQVDVERRLGEAEYHLSQLAAALDQSTIRLSERADAVLHQVEALTHELLQAFEQQSQRLDETWRQALQDERASMQREIDALRSGFATAELALAQVNARQATQQQALDALVSRLDEPKGWRRVLGGAVSFARHLRRNASAFVDLWRVRKFDAQALGDVEATATRDATVTWRSTGDDPRFLLVARGAGMPSSGWYSLTTRIDLVDTTALVEPSLYVDYGQGMDEAGKIVLRFDPLRPDQRVLVKFEGDVRTLRFDPSTQPCKFALADVRLRKLGVVEAALRLAAPTLTQLWQSPRHLSIAFGDAYKAWRLGGVAEVEKRLRALHDARQRDLGYANWVARFDTFTPDDRARLAAAVAQLPRRPKISIIVPVYNTPERWLRRCIDSVLEQAYPDWQLCVADDASTQPHVATVLAEYAARDARIRVVAREANGHISAASNSALALADGDCVALLDHDDELRPHALYLVAQRFVENPDLGLVYSDEDKIDEQGRRYDPYFKPDWNPELFYSQNYLSHLSVYRAALVREVGGFRIGFEGSQDYDLALRCVERLRPDQIAHIPHVLYHWRSVAGSTARADGEKSYTHDASQRALREHFARTGVAATVEHTAQGYFRSRYALPDPLPKVSLIVPTRDKVHLLRMCLDGLLERTDYPALEVIVVDNQSSEPQTLDYFATLRGDPRVRILPYDQPFNFSAINNFAAAQARGDVIGLINNDIEVIDPGWLRELVAYAARDDVGAVGAKLYYPDDRIQHAGVVVGFGGVAGHSYQRMPRACPGQMNRANLVQNLSSVTAACLLLRREVYEKVGGLDENLCVAFNDIDFCLRIRDLGLSIVWTPYAELYHHESASRGYEDSPEKLARFHREIRFMQERWGERLLADPAYNPNLSLDTEPFELAWPPRVDYAFRPAGD